MTTKKTAGKLNEGKRARLEGGIAKDVAHGSVPEGFVRPKATNLPAVEQKEKKK